jgi:outer membrane lipoprotein-sorting protein
MKRLLFLSMLALCVSAAAEQTPEEKKGTEIMRKYYKEMTTKNFRTDVTMQLVDRAGKTQTRHVKRLSKTDEKDQEKFLIIFVDPPTVRHTALLMVEHENKDDDVWYYIPAIKRAKRISGSNMRNSYVGTEFTYKDIRREHVEPEENCYVYVKNEKLNGADHFVLDASPVSTKEKDEQGYGGRRLWVRADSYLVSQVEFYKENGDHLKTLVATDLRPVGDKKRPRYFKLTMTSAKGVKTIIEFKNVEIDGKDPADKFFTKAFLTSKK